MRMNNPDREMMNLDALDPTDEEILAQEQELERDAQLLGNEYTLEAAGRDYVS